jgi:hypothetical protein
MTYVKIGGENQSSQVVVNMFHSKQLRSKKLIFFRMNNRKIIYFLHVSNDYLNRILYKSIHIILIKTSLSIK